MRDDAKLLIDFKTHADTMELAAVDFLDPHGRIARDRTRYVAIRVKFIDGTTFTLPRRLEAQFKSQQFRLPQTKNES